MLPPQRCALVCQPLRTMTQPRPQRAVLFFHSAVCQQISAETAQHGMQRVEGLEPALLGQCPPRALERAEAVVSENDWEGLDPN